MGAVTHCYNHIFCFIWKIKLLKYISAILFSSKYPGYILTLILRFKPWSVENHEKGKDTKET